ncbi:nuclear transport factor 2 family protein [Flavobacterium sp. DG2-3]|uniref:nuclear transport factor 2 family protein n=1 Tax=Flavobacterium sp. DG2-3 TaxID=3068317 RepID=UPI0027400566|nr:nuclear transport factor 2 family protein [Flavobacterium sp. DG2-3]MDP5202368.1 nuclear transport factor 2 family protein [Flavobacterium sp. DG2-3]
MESFGTNAALITAVLMNYFNGIYNGDVTTLQSAFHPQAIVSGDINGQPYFKTVEQYLEGVKNRKSPKELGEDFKMKILSLEIINNTAVAKVQVPIFEYNYYDQLSLVVVDGKWIIVNKLLTNVK